MANLTRYNLEWFNRTATMDNFHQMVASDEGAWVKFDDIKELLQTAHNSRVMPCAHWIPGGICNVFVDYRCSKDKSCIISARA